MHNYSGQQFGSYRLLAPLGRGGFADVYLARHTYLRTQVALKLFRARLDDEHMQDFLAQARVIARLQHPHIVRILECDIHDSAPFLVMQHAPNGNLRQRHPKGSQLPLTTVLAYTRQAASALDYAHRAGQVHGDVKPENMLLGDHNELLLSDFGLSPAASRTFAAHQSQVVGTITYMAPEQLQGRPRPASDQYALAALAYEWLSGTPPFEGENAIDIASKHLYAPLPPLPTRVPGLPSTVDAVITTALAKDFRQRFESVQAFAGALERAYRIGTMPTPALQTSDSTTLPSERDAAQRREQPSEGRKRISRRAALIGGGSVAALAAVGSAYLGWLALAPKKTLVTRITLLSPSPLPTPTPAATAPASAIGDTVYVYTGHSDWVDTANWSPNGQRIVSASFDQTLHVWDAFTGQHELRQHDYAIATGGEGAAWSPDGNHLASASVDRTVQISAAISGKHVLTYSNHTGSVIAVSWSPNGKRIVSGDGYSNIFLWEAATGQTVLTYRKHSGIIYSVRWSPNGKFIASCAEDTTVQVWQATD